MLECANYANYAEGLGGLDFNGVWCYQFYTQVTAVGRKRSKQEQLNSWGIDCDKCGE